MSISSPNTTAESPATALGTHISLLRNLEENQILLGDTNLKSVKSSGKKKKTGKSKSKSKQSSGAKSAQLSKKMISIR